MKNSPVILICPLDWGLGHASRCAPLIRAFQEAGAQVILGGNGKSGQWLREEFPELRFIEFSAPEVNYRRSGMGFKDKLLGVRQLYRSIENDRKTLGRVIVELKPDIILSDNRYGLSHPEIQSVLITHQLNPVLPRILKGAARRKLQTLHKNFNEVWIPDYEHEPSLSGQLSHPSNTGKPVKYLGPLSRFEATQGKRSTDFASLSVISAPEHYRSHLEVKLKKYLSDQSGNHLIVSSKSGNTASAPAGNVTVIHQPSSVELQGMISSSRQLISTGGYSSIMDYYSIQKNALLIPTPGQSEQVYLSEHLDGKFGFKKFSWDLPLSEQNIAQAKTPIQQRIDLSRFIRAWLEKVV